MIAFSEIRKFRKLVISLCRFLLRQVDGCFLVILLSFVVVFVKVPPMTPTSNKPTQKATKLLLQFTPAQVKRIDQMRRTTCASRTGFAMACVLSVLDASQQKGTKR